jgi:4'-phosphopantetheinyl transferase
MSVGTEADKRRSAAEEGRWTPGPANPALEAHEVHVWRVDLETVSDDVLVSLSSDERERAAHIVNAPKAQLWARSRGVLRILLARYVELEPDALGFAADAIGKPVLAAAARLRARPGRERLHFNISHSGSLALYGFTQAGAVGVDVQVARGRIDHVAIAARAFGAEPARRLEGLAPSKREREFLRAWVNHEAGLKCRGTGIGETRAGEGAQEREPWIAELYLGSQAPGAVALEQPPRVMRCWDWSCRDGLEDPQRDRLRDRLAADGSGHRHGHAPAMLAE